MNHRLVYDVCGVPDKAYQAAARVYGVQQHVLPWERFDKVIYTKSLTAEMVRQRREERADGVHDP